MPRISQLLEGNNNGTHAMSLPWGANGASSEDCGAKAQTRCPANACHYDSVFGNRGTGCVNSPGERASLEEERVLNVVQK